jgi:hypothetical protein
MRRLESSTMRRQALIAEAAMSAPKKAMEFPWLFAGVVRFR